LDRKIKFNYEKYLERVNFYRTFGYDLEKERNFIIDKSAPVSGRILEIGTGKGHFAIALAKRGFNFISIDISASEQRIAEMNLRYFGLENRVSFKVMDARDMDLPDASFDMIFSVNVFHHLESPLEVLQEVTRLLRLGGKVVLSDFNAKGMRLINMCHSYEGRRHDVFKQGLKKSVSYFTRRNFSVREFDSEAQHIVIAKNRTRKK